MSTCQSLITLTFLVQGDTSFPNLQKALTNQGFVWMCFNKTFCRESNLGFGRIKHGFPWVDHSSWLYEEVCDTKILVASFVVPHPWSSIFFGRITVWLNQTFDCSQTQNYRTWSCQVLGWWFKICSGYPHVRRNTPNFKAEFHHDIPKHWVSKAPNKNTYSNIRDSNSYPCNSMWINKANICLKKTFGDIGKCLHE